MQAIPDHELDKECNFYLVSAELQRSRKRSESCGHGRSSRPGSSRMSHRPTSGDRNNLDYIKFDKRGQRQQSRPATASAVGPAQLARLSNARPSTADASLQSRRNRGVINLKMRALTMDASASDASTPDVVSATHQPPPPSSPTAASWPRETMSRSKSLETLSSLSGLSMPVSHYQLVSFSPGNWELKPSAKRIARRKPRPYYVEANTRGCPPDKLAWSLPVIASADGKSAAARARASELFSLQGYRFVQPQRSAYPSMWG